MPSLKYRHRARRMAMQALCALDAQGDKAMDLAVGFIRESADPVEVIHQAQVMLAGAWSTYQQADASLGQHSQHWDVRRMTVVDRNILRLAWWELHTAHAPAAVVINEALRLAKEFSTAESPRFINGILDTIARAMAKPQEKPAPPPKTPDAPDAADADDPADDLDELDLDDVEDEDELDPDDLDDLDDIHDPDDIDLDFDDDWEEDD